MRLHERELERRVRERTEHLEAANRDLEAFAAAVAHDLRSPVRSILGFAAILESQHGSNLSEDARACLGRVREGASSMAAILEGLLVLSRVGQEELDKTSVDLGSLAGGILRRLRRDEPAREVAWAVDEPLIAVGDETLLTILLENLLSNAWKFTRRTPRAWIEFSGSLREGRSVYSVRDNGVGFDAAQAHRIFAPFQRLHAPEEFPGVGIGLATVARIVGRHGGRIWAESQEGAGAAFSFTL